jgi:hypothetical protein
LGRAFHVLVAAPGWPVRDTTALSCKSNLPELKRFPRIQPARNEPAGGCIISVDPGFPPAPREVRVKGPRPPVPLRGGVPPPKGNPDHDPPTKSEQAAARPRAQAYRTRMRAERDRQIIGSHGPASPCKRIDPRTGEVIEVIAPSTKMPARRIR